MVRLADVLHRINELFADEDFSPAQQQSWVEGIATVLVDDPVIRTQAAANTRAQFMASPDLGAAVNEAVLSNIDSHGRMADMYFERGAVQLEMQRMLGELVYEMLAQRAR